VHTNLNTFITITGPIQMYICWWTISLRG